MVRLSTSGVAMISQIENGNGTFSADVKLNLYAAGEEIQLGLLGSGFAILRFAQSIDPNEGEIESIVDGKFNR